MSLLASHCAVTARSPTYSVWPGFSLLMQCPLAGYGKIYVQDVWHGADRDLTSRVETSDLVKYFYWADPSKAVWEGGLRRRYFFCGPFMFFFLACVCYALLRVCLFVPFGHLLGKGWPLGSRLWYLTGSLSLSHWYPGSVVVLDCIDSWSLHLY